MSMTDPIADLLTRVRNAHRIDYKTVDVPHSSIKKGILEILKKEGFIEDFRVTEVTPSSSSIRVYLKYGPDGEKVISTIRRVSKPGRRVYRRFTDVEPVLNGLGLGIYTTSHGILTDRECRERKVGGECLCEVW